MKKDELRPVRIPEYAQNATTKEWVDVNGWFHCWAGLSEHAYALIELPNGDQVRCDPGTFYFTDRSVAD